MKFIKILSIVGIVLLVVSCSKEDGSETPSPPPPSNQAPTFNNDGYTFTVSEDSGSIGQVSAADPDQDNLTYSITGNGSGLFDVTPSGEVIVKEGMTLDFETSNQHNITVSVSDGEKTTETTVTISVMDVPEPYPNDKHAFVTTWKIPEEEVSPTLGIGLSIDARQYDFTINWGDGTIEDIVGEEYGIQHEYESYGEYQISIIGEFHNIGMGMPPLFALTSKTWLYSIDQWGTIEWKSFKGAFVNCNNLRMNATDLPNLDNVSSMSYMFDGASSFEGGNINEWDVKGVNEMSYMFRGAISFNGNIGNWGVNVGQVTTMDGMFEGASSFNQDLSAWDTSNVGDMYNMFEGASSFNQNLGNWDIRNVSSISFHGSGLSTANFDSTIIGWADNLQNFKGPVSIKANDIFKCYSSDIIDVLELDYSWTVDDGGLDPNCND